MADNVFPDPATPFGERVLRHLNDDRIVWLTTVGRDGTPQPNPVWFIWSGGRLLVQNLPSAGRVAHVRRRPDVALNFNSDFRGEDVVIVIGRAELSDEPLSPTELEQYVAKYGDQMPAISGSAEAFLREYPVLMKITPGKVRGF